MPLYGDLDLDDTALDNEDTVRELSLLEDFGPFVASLLHEVKQHVVVRVLVQVLKVGDLLEFGLQEELDWIVVMVHLVLQMSKEVRVLSRDVFEIIGAQFGKSCVIVGEDCC